MDNFKKEYSSHHHAHVIELPSMREESIKGVVSRVKESYTTQPEVHVLTYEQLLIDDAHELVALQQRKNRKEENRLFCVVFTSITNDAQNVLLKTLEEPARGVAFVLIVPNKHILLPTVLSRCVFVACDEEDAEGESFLAMSLKERLASVSKLLDAPSGISLLYARLERDILAYGREGSFLPASFLESFFHKKSAALSRPQVRKYVLEELVFSLPIISKK